MRFVLFIKQYIVLFFLIAVAIYYFIVNKF
nr:MAG TPA: hypothetical protein [Caudoviricetes sp.]